MAALNSENKHYNKIHALYLFNEFIDVIYRSIYSTRQMEFLLFLNFLYFLNKCN